MEAETPPRQCLRLIMKRREQTKTGEMTPGSGRGFAGCARCRQRGNAMQRPAKFGALLEILACSSSRGNLRGEMRGDSLSLCSALVSPRSELRSEPAGRKTARPHAAPTTPEKLNVRGPNRALSTAQASAHRGSGPPRATGPRGAHWVTLQRHRRGRRPFAADSECPPRSVWSKHDVRARGQGAERLRSASEAKWACLRASVEDHTSYRKRTTQRQSKAWTLPSHNVRRHATVDACSNRHVYKSVSLKAVFPTDMPVLPT